MTNYDTYRRAAADWLQEHSDHNAVTAVRSIAAGRPFWIRHALGQGDEEEAETAAEYNAQAADNLERFVECTRSVDEYLLERQRIDLARWQSQMTPRQFALWPRRRERANERDLPTVAPRPLGRYPKDRVFDLVRSFRPVKGTCRGDLSAPTVPVPVWPDAKKIIVMDDQYTGAIDVEWEPSRSDCPVTYGVQMQPQNLLWQSTSDRWIHDPRSIVTEVAATRTAIRFAGGFAGRWRVWAVDSNGRHSPFSPWQHFGLVLQAHILPPDLKFEVEPNAARPAEEVDLLLESADPGSTVMFQGHAMPKKVRDGGRRLRVMIPANARVGVTHFYLAYQGRRYRQHGDFRVLP